jgi:chromosome segregation ATPase
MNILQQLLPYLLPAITGVLGLFLGTRTRNATDSGLEQTAKGTELDNVQKALGTYREMMADLKINLQALNDAYDKLESEFEEQEIIVKSYRRLIKQKDETIEALVEEKKLFLKKIRTCEFNCKLIPQNESPAN